MITHLKMIPPFFPNYRDNDCWQCSLRSILEYFEPLRVWTLEELYELTGKDERYYTWPFKTCSDLPAYGYELKAYSDLDFSAFAENPVEFIYEFFTDGVESAIKNTNFAAEIEYAKKAVANQAVFQHCKNGFEVNDIKELLSDGYLCLVAVDGYKLWSVPEGSAGHAVLVYGIDDTHVILHDCGDENVERQRPAWRISHEALMNACVQNDRMYGLFAIRRKEGR